VYFDFVPSLTATICWQSPRANT